MPQKIFLGIDIGSAHLKVVALCPNPSEEIYPVGIIASKLQKASRLRDIIFPLVRKIISEKSKDVEVYANIVTSIDVAYPEEDYLSILKKLTQECNAKIYLLSDNLVPVQLEKTENWFFLSSINSLRYIAQKYLENGVLVHMNSSSTLFIPVKKGIAVSLEPHYSSGIGMWTGALYRHVFNITGNGVYVFGRKIYVSPVAGSLIDILFQIMPEKAEKMLELYNSPMRIDELRRDSGKRIMHILGIFPQREYRNFRYGGLFNKENQVRVASYHIYANFLQALVENLLKILSDVDIDVENMEVAISGIGEPILEDAFHLFRGKMIKLSEKLSPKKSVMLEAYGAALSLQEYVGEKAK